MRYVRIITLTLMTTLMLAACGSNHKATSSQKQEAQAEATKFEVRAKQCLPTKAGMPTLSVLRTKAGRDTFAACLVPPAQRAAFARCSESAVIGHFKKVVIEQGLNACLEKVS